MAYQVRGAKRSNAKPLIGLYAGSGAGKTYSALLVARGFVGPTGKIVMIETESGRGESYADPLEYPELKGPNPESNYGVVPMRDVFSPTEYGKAIDAAESVNPDALIIDSASHEWEGRGGVLDMAAEREEKGMQGALVWQRPKMDHNTHFVLRFTQTAIPLVILCMRAKKPMERRKKQGGGFEWFRSDDLVPIQSDGILSEMFVQGWIENDNHHFHPGKISARGIAPIFPPGAPLGIETGQRLREWAEKPSAPADSSTAPQTTDHTERDPADDGGEDRSTVYYRNVMDALENAKTKSKLNSVYTAARKHFSALTDVQVDNITKTNERRKVELT